MRVPRDLTDTWIDSRFMPRFASASYDERRGILRMLHALHEGLKREDLAVVPEVSLQVRTIIADASQITPEDLRQIEDEDADIETAYQRLEEQAEVLMQPGM